MTSPDNVPATVAGLGPRDQVAASLGAMRALSMVSSWSLATRAVLLRQIKQAGTYKELAGSWEEFCSAHLPWSRRTADDAIRFLEVLGEEFLAAADGLGLGHRHLRALAAAPSNLIPHAEGDEIVIGEERVPLSDKVRVVELLDQLVLGQERLTDQIASGEEQLSKKDRRVRDLEKGLSDLEAVVAGSVASPFNHLMIRALRNLRQAADLLSDAEPEDRPSPQEVLALVEALSPTWSEIIHYGGQYVTPDWTRDVDALRDHMVGVPEEQPPGGADGPLPGDWGDEDKLL